MVFKVLLKCSLSPEAASTWPDMKHTTASVKCPLPSSEVSVATCSSLHHHCGCSSGAWRHATATPSFARSNLFSLLGRMDAAVREKGGVTRRREELGLCGAIMRKESRCVVAALVREECEDCGIRSQGRVYGY